MHVYLSYVWTVGYKIIVLQWNGASTLLDIVMLQGLLVYSSVANHGPVLATQGRSWRCHTVRIHNHAPALSSALIGQSYMTCLKHVTPMYGNVNFR